MAGPAPDPERSSALFRICQARLNTLACRAQATQVTLRLDVAGDCLRLTITDDDRGGADPEIASPATLGLLEMCERAAGLGGDLSIVGRPGEGTTVTVLIPLSHA